MPDAAILDELRALRADVAAMRRELAALRPARRPRLVVRDREALEVLLPAIAQAAGAAAWTCGDVAELALLPGRDALAHALAPHVARRGGLRALGRLLARASGVDVAGLRVEAIGRASGAVVWRVEQSPKT